jgi:trk system potassium uptake protein TrkH
VIPARTRDAGWRERLVRTSGTLLGVSSVLAVVALTLEHGFDLPPWMTLYLHAILIAVVAAFAGNRLLRLIAAGDRVGHLRNHFIEFSVLALFLLVLPVAGGAFLLYLEVYVVLVLGLEAARLNARIMAWSVRPAFVIVGSFAVLILAGTVALLVPRASAVPERPLTVGDAIFTSTSAACVTGLTVRPLGTDFSPLGRWIVLVLIQIGGLGIVTYTLFFALLQQRSLSVRHSVVIKEVFSLEIIGGVGRLLATVIAATLIFEALGAAVIWFLTPDESGRLEWAVFHSVSAFCNAGFARWPDHVPLQPGFLIVLLALTVIGGLGFPVLQNLWRMARQKRWERGSLLRGDAPVPERLTIHSRIVLMVTPALLIVGAVFFFLGEGHREPLKDQPLPMKLMISLFQSGVARTSGFTAVDVEGTQQSSQVATIALMSVGASPASTGGGIKTVTMALLMATLLSMIRNREDVEIFGRSIQRLFINAAVSILFLYGAAVFAFSLVLAILEPGIPYRKLLFETVSALSTVGLSTGATAESGPLARLVLCAAMFVGRVGPLAVMMSIASRAPSGNYRYPTEGVIVS